MDFKKEEYEKQFQLWKRWRAEAEVPEDFADRVMASVHGTHILQRWDWLRRAKAVFERSKLLQAGVYLAAVTFLMMRLVALLAILIPLN